MSKFWNLKTRSLELSAVKIMGIINVTPDSFSDGGRFQSSAVGPFEPDVDAIVAAGRRLVDEGAELLDVGGESTRPGAEPVDAEEERRRVAPAIRALARELNVPISIDSYRPSTLDAALDAGAEIVNDVASGRFIESQNRFAREDERDFPEETAEVVRRHGAAVVLMAATGSARTHWTPTDPDPDAIVDDVFAFLARRRDRFIELGVPLDKIAFDPGVGFGKNAEQNWRLLRAADKFDKLGGVVLFGCSRKRFLVESARDFDASSIDERDFATAATSVALARRGVDVLRVHNVARTARAIFWAKLAGDLN